MIGQQGITALMPTVSRHQQRRQLAHLPLSGAIGTSPLIHLCHSDEPQARRPIAANDDGFASRLAKLFWTTMHGNWALCHSLLFGCTIYHRELASEVACVVLSTAIFARDLPRDRPLDFGRMFGTDWWTESG